jgi:hypothetical protein
MSISTQQLKRILGSFSTTVAKDVSGIKTEYATKKDVEGFAKLSDLNNTYIKKGDIHTEDYVTNVIFRDAYQNRLVKKTDLPAFDTIATKQEISDAVAAVHVPSIEGLAKESEVEAKLADYAKTTEVAATYATKEAVNAINSLDADTIATLKNLSEHSDLTAIANKVDNVYTKAETNDKLATKADVTAIPDVSGLATKQEVAAAVAGITIPSIEGLAKTTDIEAAYAKKTELPDVSGLATKAEVEALKTDFVTEETLTQNINQFSINIDGKINEAKGEVEAKVAAVDGKLADYAKKTELPSVEGLAKATEIESTYAKKTELPDVSRLVTKTELSDATVNLATKSEIGIIEGRLTEFLPKLGAASLFAQRAELNDYLRKDDVSNVSVTKAAYDAKVQELESEISTLKAKLAAVASGTTEQRPTENLVVGQQYFDTTLGVPVYWNGTEWHNPFANITTIEVEPH